MTRGHLKQAEFEYKSKKYVLTQIKVTQMIIQPIILNVNIPSIHVQKQFNWKTQSSIYYANSMFMTTAPIEGRACINIRPTNWSCVSDYPTDPSKKQERKGVINIFSHFQYCQEGNLVHFSHYTGSEASDRLKMLIFEFSRYKLEFMDTSFVEICNFWFWRLLLSQNSNAVRLFGSKLSTDLSEIQFQTKQVCRL